MKGVGVHGREDEQTITVWRRVSSEEISGRTGVMKVIFLLVVGVGTEVERSRRQRIG